MPPSQENELPTPGSEPAVIDTVTFADLQANAGADFVVELVDTFAVEAPAILAELTAAFEEKAADRFRRAAHSLKSNSNTFGAGRLAEMARALELGGLPASDAPVEALHKEFDRTVAALKELARG
jgi:histidine phosphotransfer protein HptB